MLRWITGSLFVLGLVSPLFAANDLPPGKMQGKVKSFCTQCHAAANITKQRLSRVAWAKTVDKMIAYGAEVDDGDKPALIDYLSTHFGAGKPGSVEKAAKSEKIHEN
jgi:hypothetical protein